MPSATEDPSLVEELCCDCACPVGQNTTYTLFTTATQFGGTSLITFSYIDINNVSQTIGLQPGQYYTVCVLGTASPPNPIILIGYEFLVDISIDACNCNTTDVIIN